MKRVLIVLAALACALSASAAEFVQVGTSTAQTFQQPLGATARALGGGMASAWDEPGSARWSPAAPPAASRGTEFGVAFEEPEPFWDRWSWALRADLGDVRVSLLWDDWSTDPVELRTAYDPVPAVTELSARQQIEAVSWRARTWAGGGGETALSLGAGLRHLHLETGAASSLDEADLGAVLTRTPADPEAPGLAGWSVGVAATNLLGSTFDVGTLSADLPGHRRLGGRIAWNALPRNDTGRPLLRVAVTADWERARLDGWYRDATTSVGVETLWAGFASFRYGGRSQPDNSVYAPGSFGFGLRGALLDDRLHLRADMAVVDMNEDLGYDTLEVYSLRVAWRP